MRKEREKEGDRGERKERKRGKVSGREGTAQLMNSVASKELYLVF